MPIWKLTPTDITSPHWNNSTYKGEIIVRAPSEDEARMQATLVFTVASKHEIGADSPQQPWQMSELATCSRVDNSGFDETGATAVLSPPDRRPREQQPAQQHRG